MGHMGRSSSRSRTKQSTRKTRMKSSKGRHNRRSTSWMQSRTMDSSRKSK
jgi:hypothetical protein